MIPAPMPPTTPYQNSRPPSVWTVEAATQLIPISTPPAMVSSRGPNLSTSHPSKGTSHVSSSTNSANTSWTLLSFPSPSLTMWDGNRVQAYCMFALGIWASTAATRIHHRHRISHSVVVRSLAAAVAIFLHPPEASPASRDD